MGLIYNGNEVKNLIYNGQQVNILKYNGEVVWQWEYFINAKYNELDTILPKLTAGTYDLTVDCTGVPASEFIGINSKKGLSPFGQKLYAAPADVMFNLTPINVGADVTDTSLMFVNCQRLASIDTSGFTNVTDASDMFRDCRKLTSIDTSGLTRATEAAGLLMGCDNLTEVTGSGLTKVTNAWAMFMECRKLKSIDTSVFTNVTNAEGMFKTCNSITSIDTSVFTNVTNAKEMFYYCNNLINITWGDSFRPTESVFWLLKGASAAKTIIASADSKKFIEANAAPMQLTNYTIVLK